MTWHVFHLRMQEFFEHLHQVGVTFDEEKLRVENQWAMADVPFSVHKPCVHEIESSKGWVWDGSSPSRRGDREYHSQKVI